MDSSTDVITLDDENESKMIETKVALVFEEEGTFTELRTQKICTSKMLVDPNKWTNLMLYLHFHHSQWEISENEVIKFKNMKVKTGFYNLTSNSNKIKINQLESRFIKNIKFNRQTVDKQLKIIKENAQTLDFEDYMELMLPPKLMELIENFTDQIDHLKVINNNFVKNLKQVRKDEFDHNDKSVVHFVQAVLKKHDLVPHITHKLSKNLLKNKSNVKEFTKSFKSSLNGPFGYALSDYLYSRFSGNKFILSNLYTRLDDKILGGNLQNTSQQLINDTLDSTVASSYGEKLQFDTSMESQCNVPIKRKRKRTKKILENQKRITDYLTFIEPDESKLTTHGSQSEDTNYNKSKGSEISRTSLKTKRHSLKTQDSVIDLNIGVCIKKRKVADGKSHSSSDKKRVSQNHVLDNDFNNPMSPLLSDIKQESIDIDDSTVYDSMPNDFLDFQMTEDFENCNIDSSQVISPEDNEVQKSKSENRILRSISENSCRTGVEHENACLYPLADGSIKMENIYDDDLSASDAITNKITECYYEDRVLGSQDQEGSQKSQVSSIDPLAISPAIETSLTQLNKNLLSEKICSQSSFSLSSSGLSLLSIGNENESLSDEEFDPEIKKMFKKYLKKKILKRKLKKSIEGKESTKDMVPNSSQHEIQHQRLEVFTVS